MAWICQVTLHGDQGSFYRRRRRRGPQVRQERGQAVESIARSAPCGLAAPPLRGLGGVLANDADSNSQWASQITELDGALDALKTTIAGISGDSLASALPTVLNDLQRLDTAWTALQQQVDQDCG